MSAYMVSFGMEHLFFFKLFCCLVNSSQLCQKEKLTCMHGLTIQFTFEYIFSQFELCIKPIYLAKTFFFCEFLANLHLSCSGKHSKTGILWHMMTYVGRNDECFSRLGAYPRLLANFLRFSRRMLSSIIACGIPRVHNLCMHCLQLTYMQPASTAISILSNLWN